MSRARSSARTPAGASLGAALRAADPALADRLHAFARRGRKPDVRTRPRQDGRRDLSHYGRPRAQPHRPGPPVLAQAALAPLGRLVIVTDTDLPCSLNLAVARPGDHSGLVCAYLDSDLYNNFGWWFEPPKKHGEPGGAVDLREFGQRLEIMPRDGAWTFRTGREGMRSKNARRRDGTPLYWSPRNVGTSVLHIRFKGEIEAGLAGGVPKPPEGSGAPARNIVTRTPP